MSDVHIPGMISPVAAAMYVNRGFKSELFLLQPSLVDLPAPEPAVASSLKSKQDPHEISTLFEFDEFDKTPPEPPVMGTTEDEIFRKNLAKSLKDVKDVPPELLQHFQSLITEFSCIFGESPQAGGANLEAPEHLINLIPGSKPTHRRNFRMSPREVDELRDRVTEFVQKGIISPSNSPFGAPVLFIKKPDGSLRFTLDYRALNSITTKIRYPLPRIDDLLDSARGAKYYSSLDLASGYFQLKISPKDSPKTAFCTPFGQYEWKVLPMGLTNAPSTFMRAMNSVMDQVVSKEEYDKAQVNPDHLHHKITRYRDFVLVYLDDLLVMSKTPEDHVLHMRLLFSKLKSCHLQLKLSKCKFLQTQVKYLGHLINKDGILPAPDKIEILQKWELPTTVLGMQQFLGLANYFRKFIPNYSRIAAPLHGFTKKAEDKKSGDRFPISREECLLAFNTIKKLLMNPPLLRFPDPDLPYKVISDASITGCGAILTQEDRPVAYYSHKFSDTERGYGTGEQEMLGIVLALMEWRCYLEGCKGLTVVTDHNPLTYFTVQPTLSRRQARWAEKLSRFGEYKVEYRPGKTNPADGLSRLYDFEKAVVSALKVALYATTVLEFRKNPGLMQRIKEASKTDEYIQSFRKSVQLHETDEGYYLLHGFIVVPQSVQPEVIRMHHDHITSGHMGVTKTVDLIQRHFWWPRMKDTVNTFIQKCDQCQRNKPSRKRPFGLLQPLAIPDTRWDTVTLDFLPALPLNKNGNDSVLVFVDKLSKYVVLVPTSSSLTAEECSRLFIKHIFQEKGLPKRLVSDRDKLFTSKFWKEFMKHLEVKLHMSTSYHPQTDGQTEKVNSVIEPILRSLANETRSNWEDLLPFVSFAINNSKSESTGETPFFLNSGQHPRSPAVAEHVFISDHIPALGMVLHEMHDTLDTVKKLLRSAQDRQKSYADEKRRPHEFKEGDSVLLSSKNFRMKKGVRKLSPLFLGPYPIQEMVGPNAARLALSPSMSRFHPVFHVSLLKPYHAEKGYQPPQQSPELVDTSTEPMFTIEKILGKRLKTIGKTRSKKRKTRVEYLIKWEGYDDTNNSWEPAENLNEAALESYQTKGE